MELRLEWPANGSVGRRVRVTGLECVKPAEKGQIRGREGHGNGTGMARQEAPSSRSIVGLGGQESACDAERVANADLRHCYPTHTLCTRGSNGQGQERSRPLENP